MRLACYLSPTDSSTKASGFSSTAYLSKLKNPKVKMPFLMDARVTLNVVKIASAVSLTHRDVGNANARRSLFQMGRIACQDQMLDAISKETATLMRPVLMTIRLKVTYVGVWRATLVTVTIVRRR